MKERIREVDKFNVRVKRNQTDITTLTAFDGSVAINPNMGTASPSQWDREGLEALLDCINCFLATNNFAALADTSAVPFLAKHVRVDDLGQIRDGTVVEKMIDGRWRVKTEHRDYVIAQAKDFRPLTTPAPRVRPYEPWEAAKHLGRFFRTETNTLSLDVVKSDCVRHGEYNSSLLALTYKDFAKCTWADDGSPCGSAEPT